METQCPRCRKKTIFAPENPYRPFCSERCKLMDLGAWANEDYRVPSTESASGQDLVTRSEDESDEET